MEGREESERWKSAWASSPSGGHHHDNDYDYDEEDHDENYDEDDSAKGVVDD